MEQSDIYTVPYVRGSENLPKFFKLALPYIVSVTHWHTIISFQVAPLASALNSWMLSILLVKANSKLDCINNTFGTAFYPSICPRALRVAVYSALLKFLGSLVDAQHPLSATK